MTDTDQIITGNTFDVLPDLPDNYAHACVTDPPYGLAFMGRDWDDFEPKEYQEWCEEWAREVKRVLKPGGHLLAFSGNRTHHRLFTGVEDAGFEIRDTITWHYGSGFPKATDVSKHIDRRRGTFEDREVTNTRTQNDIRADSYNDAEGKTMEYEDTEAAHPDAQRWEGFKTALKPATEYVVMARKPFDGATVDAVLEHGTGALNISDCRVGAEERKNAPTAVNGGVYGDTTAGENEGQTVEGRYPSNVVFDETEAERLDDTVGEKPSCDPHTLSDKGERSVYSDDEPNERHVGYDDSGGPSRYFYTSKASKSERTENGSITNDHPTVKPVDLMEWLVKLVTREDQIVLDPFAGSGTTCKAAKGLNRRFIGIERQPRYADIARVRCGLTPEDPSVVRDDSDQRGFEEYT